MEDFFVKVGLAPRIKSHEIMCYDQIHMEQTNCEKLKDFMLRNVKKLRKYRGYKDRYLHSLVGMEWFYFSPVSHLSMPTDELWVFPKDFDWRSWFAEKEGDFSS